MTAATGAEVTYIRKAVADDAGAVRDCAEEAYAQYVVAIGRKPAPMVADFEAQIAAGQVYVAAGSGAAILGFIVFFARGDHMFLENVAVSAAAAGQGTGKTLIGFCEAEAQRLGLDRVQLYTNEKMVGNLSIYPHLGYRETGRRAEDGFNRIYFEKELG